MSASTKEAVNHMHKTNITAVTDALRKSYIAKSAECECLSPETAQGFTHKPLLSSQHPGVFDNPSTS